MLLEAKNINVTLNGTRIVKNISFSVDRGEVLTILGPNGAGKSVLVRAILGLTPYSGEVKWEGDSTIGSLPQGLTPLKMKGMPLTVRDFFKLKRSHFTDDHIESMLKRVGLSHSVKERLLGTLSGGQFQRVLIAWVLISRPDIIFFDEPTTGIDIGGGETIYSLLDSIRKKEKLAIVLVTHDLNVVYEYSTNVLCLGGEGWLCYGPPREVLDTQTLEALFGVKLKYHKHG